MLKSEILAWIYIENKTYEVMYTKKQGVSENIKNKKISKIIEFRKI